MVSRLMKFPCKECISFALCKQRIKTLDSPDLTQFSKKIDCQSMRDYITYLDSSDFHKDSYRITKFLIVINRARLFYGLPEVDIPRRNMEELKMLVGYDELEKI